MKTLHSFSLACILLLPLAACGGDDSPESLARQNIAVMKDFGATLAKVTDKSSAKKQIPALEKLAKKAKDLQDRMTKAGTPDEAESEKLMKELGPALGECMQKITTEMIRIGSNPELQEALGPTLDELDF